MIDNSGFCNVSFKRHTKTTFLKRGIAAAISITQKKQFLKKSRELLAVSEGLQKSTMAITTN